MSTEQNSSEQQAFGEENSVRKKASAAIGSPNRIQDAKDQPLVA
jgi:hypothetical protein